MRYFLSLIARWLINSLGLYVAIIVIAHLEHLSENTAPNSLGIVLIAGLIFSIVNSVVRPIAIIVSLPAILLTLGLFTFVVNGFMVWISLLLVPGISLSFINSIFAGIILGIINFVISNLIEFRAGAAEKRNGYNPAKS
jgi:putative membrane protein